jgi:glycosyltransferase involved in cell wall biosynthesis
VDEKTLARPKVSAVIPNYNYSHYLGEAINSALMQTYSNVEVIVVDDGSTDASRDVLLTYGDSIKVIFQQNGGVSAARNNGVAASSGEFVAFLDADDAWLPEKIEKQVAMFHDVPTLGLVHVGVDEIDAGGTSRRQRRDGSVGDATHDLLMLGRRGILGGGSGIMVPRSLFDDVGGFDTRLSTSADWDFFYRVASGHKVGFVDEVLINYRFHNTNMRGNVAAMERDMMLAFQKAFADRQRDDEDAAYGSLYKTLAGSYFRAGEPGPFLRTAFKSVVHQPANLLYFLMFPLRRIKSQ